MKTLTLILALCISVNCLPAEETDVETTQAPQILSAPEGRYVFGQVSFTRQDQYMLDTKTGRLWRLAVNSEGMAKLLPVPYIQIIGDEAFIPESDEEVDQIRAFTRQSMLNTVREQTEAANNKKNEE